MSAKVTTKDHGWNSFIKIMDEIKKGDPHVKVGVFADQKTGGQVRDGGFTNVEIAAVHEYGAPKAHIPERSFLRSSFTRNVEKYQTRIRQHLKNVIGGKYSLHKMFDLLGLEAMTDVKKGITEGAGIPPPNAPSTIARKGSDRPLVDTGRLLAALTWVVQVGGHKGEH